MPRPAEEDQTAICVMTFADLVAEFETIDEGVAFIVQDVLTNPELYRGNETELIFTRPNGTAIPKFRNRLRLVVLDRHGQPVSRWSSP